MRETEIVDRWAYEYAAFSDGYKLVCGIDEAGRGPLAGPVCAAAVILPPDCRIEGLNDSKKLTDKRRRELYDVIVAQAAAYGSDVVARACLLQLLAGLNRFALAAPARHEVEDKAGPVVAEVLHYINEHYPDELSLDLLSAKFFISKYHLSHEFHRLVGTSVYRYIIQKRLVIAKQMLANGVAPTDVYGHCGFGDYANFYRAFKAEYHISPKQFLGRAGNENTFGG